MDALVSARKRYEEACRLAAPALDRATYQAFLAYPTDMALLKSAHAEYDAVTEPFLAEWERLILAGYAEARNK